MEVEDGREMSMVDTAGAGAGEAALDSVEMGWLYFSSSLLGREAETERRCSTGEAV